MTVRTQSAEVEEVRALGPPTVYEFRAASLHEICAHVGREERVTTLERLTAYLFDVFPLPPQSEHNHQQRRVTEMPSLSRRKLRRVVYGIAQRLWRRNPIPAILRLIYGRHRCYLGPPQKNYGSLVGSLND